MRTLSPRLRRRIKSEELAAILTDLQRREQSAHDFLASPRLLTVRYRQGLEKAGALFLSLAISAIAIILNYFIFTRMLHVNF